VARLLGQLRAIGIDLSKRQVMRLLIAGQDGFIDEARDVLRAGLANVAGLSVDDTGARHRAANGVCTQIGNDHFAWFGTTGSKSWLNFLDLLRAGHTDYVINAEALATMRSRALAGSVVAMLAEQAETHFAGLAAWQAHLAQLGIASRTPSPALRCKPSRNPCGWPPRVRALWGSVKAHGFLPNTVTFSDGAGQFDLGRHALCWVYAERLVHKLDTFTDLHRISQDHVRGLIWWFHSDLKAYRANPTPRRRTKLCARFDRIFDRQTGFATLDRLLGRLHANKPALLMVLHRPELPLHANGAPKTTSAARSRSARSVAAPAAISDATAVMRSSAWQRPAANCASPTGIISAARSRSRAARQSCACQVSSAYDAEHHDIRGFAPVTKSKPSSMWTTLVFASLSFNPRSPRNAVRSETICVCRMSRVGAVTTRSSA